MRRIRSAWLCLLAGLLLVPAALALETPPFTGWLVDRAGLLAPADHARVTTRLEQFNAVTTGQMAVLIVPSLKGDAVEDFGIRVAEAWKVGRKGHDNGLILIVAVEDRTMRVEVGYGWEGEINDARAGDVIRAMAPAFREGKYADGILGAINHLQGYLAPGSPGAAVLPSGSDKPSLGTLIFMFLFFGMIILFIVLGRFAPRGPGSSGRSSGGFGGGGGFSRGGGGGFSGGGGGSFGGGGASGKW